MSVTSRNEKARRRAAVEAARPEIFSLDAREALAGTKGRQ
jgi:hypothetical protein